MPRPARNRKAVKKGYENEVLGKVTKAIETAQAQNDENKPLQSRDAEPPRSGEDETLHSNQNKLQPFDHTKQQHSDHTRQQPLDHTKEQPLDYTKQQPFDRTKQQHFDHTKQRHSDHTKQQPLNQNDQNKLQHNDRGELLPDNHGEPLNDHHNELQRDKESHPLPTKENPSSLQVSQGNTPQPQGTAASKPSSEMPSGQPAREPLPRPVHKTLSSDRVARKSAHHSRSTVRPRNAPQKEPVVATSASASSLVSSSRDASSSHRTPTAYGPTSYFRLSPTPVPAPPPGPARPARDQAAPDQAALARLAQAALSRIAPVQATPIQASQQAAPTQAAPTQAQDVPSQAAPKPTRKRKLAQVEDEIEDEEPQPQAVANKAKRQKTAPTANAAPMQTRKRKATQIENDIDDPQAESSAIQTKKRKIAQNSDDDAQGSQTQAQAQPKQPTRKRKVDQIEDDIEDLQAPAKSSRGARGARRANRRGPSKSAPPEAPTEGSSSEAGPSDQAGPSIEAAPSNEAGPSNDNEAGPSSQANPSNDVAPDVAPPAPAPAPRAVSPPPPRRSRRIREAAAPKQPKSAAAAPAAGGDGSATNGAGESLVLDPPDGEVSYSRQEKGKGVVRPAEQATAQGEGAAARSEDQRQKAPEPEAAAGPTEDASPFLEAVRRHLAPRPAALNNMGRSNAPLPLAGVSGRNGSARRPVSEFSLATEIEELLPDPSMQEIPWIDEVWTPPMEEEFLAEMGPWAEAMVQAGEGNEAELWMWRLMIHFFGCMPHELFRYGLRMDARACTPLPEGLKPRLRKSHNMSEKFCVEMAILLFHPFWEHDLRKLRFVLQLAAASRIERHLEPLAPLDRRSDPAADDRRDVVRMSENAFLDAVLQNVKEGGVQDQLLAEYDYHRYSSIYKDRDIQLLRVELDKLREPERQPTSIPSERGLFLLHTSDLVAVRRALDTLASQGQRKWLPTADYCRGFAATAAADEVLRSTELVSPGRLGEWKRLCFLQYERERWIRNALRDEGAEDLLVDKPRSDLHPRHMHSTSVSADQRRVVIGIHYPADEDQLRPRAELPDDI